MKKITTLILAFSMCASLCACGISGNNKVSSDNSTLVENKVDENISSESSNIETKNFQNVNIGENISLDFVEMTFDKVSSSQELKPTDTSGVYSYFKDKENEQYFYLSGTMKNIGGEKYDVENVVAEIIFDDKYTYTAIIAADDGGNDFYGEYVKPFGSVKYYLYSSVPDELLSQYSSVTFKLGFKQNFSGSNYDDFEECDYLYQLNATK